jgi:predicted kinase
VSKPTVTLTKGLPGSGKSTWAREVHASRAAGGRRLKLVSKDDLRRMLDLGVWSKENEKFVVKIRNRVILDAVDEGYDVIVHDTNLVPKHETEIRQLVDKKAVVVINDSFLEVPVEECVKRDLLRRYSVGKDVIMSMHHQYVQKSANYVAVPPPARVEGAPEAIIVDLDGTMAIIGDRSPYAGHECAVDTINEPVATLVNEWSYTGPDEDRRHVIFCSGRAGTPAAREATLTWLEKHGFKIDGRTRHLFMRPQFLPDGKTKDDRKDAIIKDEIYRAEIEGKYNIAFVLDDRNQVVEYWRSIGLTCLQVAPGDF